MTERSTATFFMVAFATLAALSASPAAADRPTVLSTEPANGATGVATDLEHIVVTFSETMGGGFSTSGISGFDIEWSSDRRSVILTRSAGQPPWTAGQIFTITLNPPPYWSFADLDGNELATYMFSFTVGGQPTPGAPTVISTTPENGAADVRVDLESISITFSEPMADTTALDIAGQWPQSTQTPPIWSADGRTLNIRRANAAEPLPYHEVVRVIVNPSGVGFGDLDGLPLGTTSLAFTTADPGPDQPPAVSSSDPADGERDVGVFRDRMRVTFTKPMSPEFNMVCTTGNWDVSSSPLTWEANGRSFDLYWPDDQTLLPEGALVSVTLNPGGSPGFRDTDGNPLPETVISYTVEGPGRLIKVRPIDSRRSFRWPYYLWIPHGVPPNTVILVEPNNTGGISDRENDHDGSAMSLVGWRSQFAGRLNVPLLVPAFPRPRSTWWIYTHALDVDTMTTSKEGLERIDLQLIEMIDDARERLADLRIRAGEAVLMMGFSASGQFTNRFAILHPDRILAAVAGSPGGWPLAPLATWQGETLNYNVGIADVATLLGADLDMDAVRAMPIMLFMGDSDTNDAVPFSDAYNDQQREQIYRLFGMTPVDRWPIAEVMYDTAGMNSTFVLYPGVGHWITDEMFDDIADFFAGHIPRSKGWLRSDPGARIQP